MMSHESNLQTKQALSTEIDALKKQCAEACHIIENSPPEYVSSENADQKSLNYVEGVSRAILNSNTLIPTDANLLTSQFLNEITEKTQQLDELIAYKRGRIFDIEAEIKRLISHIETAEKVKCQTEARKKQVEQEHILRAKEVFRQMKSELQSLIETQFPQDSERMQELLATLLEASGSYVQVTSENSRLVHLLKTCNVVTFNPYNNMEVKLAYPN